jgi:hypothetical protein
VKRRRRRRRRRRRKELTNEGLLGSTRQRGGRGRKREKFKVQIWYAPFITRKFKVLTAVTWITTGQAPPDL